MFILASNAFNSELPGKSSSQMQCPSGLCSSRKKKYTKVCEECSSSFQCILDSVNSYIPRSVPSLFLMMDEHVSDSVFLVLPLDILIFQYGYFTLLSEGVRHRETNVGTQENDNWEHVTSYVLLGLKTLVLEKSRFHLLGKLTLKFLTELSLSLPLV